MAKLYTLDHKLLTETPEIRIGEKIYAVDNRQKTVKKIQEISKNISKDDPYSVVSMVMEMALGAKAAKEIDEMNLPHPAYEELFDLLMAAMTGEEAKAVTDQSQAALSTT